LPSVMVHRREQSEGSSRVRDFFFPQPSHTTVRAVPHTAVQLIRWSPCTVLRSETSPILAKYNVGTA